MACNFTHNLRYFVARQFVLQNLHCFVANLSTFKCQFSGLKMCQCKKNDKYQVCVAGRNGNCTFSMLLSQEINLDNDEDDKDTLCPLHQEKKAPQAIMGLSGRYRAPVANSSTPEYNLHLFFVNFVYVAFFRSPLDHL